MGYCFDHLRNWAKWVLHNPLWVLYGLVVGALALVAGVFGKSDIGGFAALVLIIFALVGSQGISFLTGKPVGCGWRQYLDEIEYWRGVGPLG